LVVVEGAGGESDGARKDEDKEGYDNYALIEMNTYLPTKSAFYQSSSPLSHNCRFISDSPSYTS
jgi:hypothetical protein